MEEKPKGWMDCVVRGPVCDYCERPMKTGVRYWSDGSPGNKVCFPCMERVGQKAVEEKIYYWGGYVL